MKEYEFTDKDYRTIYEYAVREFNQTSITYKQSYDNYLAKCFTKSLLGFMKANNIEVKEGNLYVSKKDN